MPLLQIGIDQQAASIEERDRLLLDPPAIAAALRRFAAESAAPEALILRTCQRLEVYHFSSGAADGWVERFCSRLEPGAAGALRELAHRGVRREGAVAVRWLFRLAAGLESLALGEPQILTQLREALARAREAGAAGPRITALFERAVRVGRLVRARTGIARGNLSVASLGVALVERRMEGGLRGRRCLVAGAGKMARIAARRLAGAGAGQIVIVNPTRERAETLARELSETQPGCARAADFHALEEELGRADLAIFATSAPEPLLRAGTLARLNRTPERPLFLLDLGAPRNVEPPPPPPGARGIELLALDALEPLCAETRRRREGESAKVEAMIEDALARFPWNEERQSRSEPASGAARRETCALARYR